MKLGTPHLEYRFRFPQWQRTRDAIGGIDMLRQRIRDYIPKLSGYESDEYDAYVNRACWYGATGRTVSGLVGSIMRKAPTITAPDDLVKQFENITLTGVTLTGFIKLLLNQVIGIGRAGVLLDVPPEKTGLQTPYFVMYKAEQIIDWPDSPLPWMTERPYVTLREYLHNEDDENNPIVQLKLLAIDEHGKYVIQLYRKGEKGFEAYKKPVYPKRRGEMLTFIPFCFFNEESLSASPSKSSLLDLVDVNLSHFRNSADLENGRHWLGSPQPWVTGEPVPQKPLPIGNGQAWFFQNELAKVGMLEFTGQGLSSLENALTTKEGLMAVLGARLLEARQKQVEATDTVQLRQAGETSILQSTGLTTSQGITQLCKWSAEWQGLESKEIAVNLNTDFLEQSLTGPELVALVQSWQNGAISHDTLYYNLERGEVAQPGITADVERERIKLQKPEIGLVSDPDF